MDVLAQATAISSGAAPRCTVRADPNTILRFVVSLLPVIAGTPLRGFCIIVDATSMMGLTPSLSLDEMVVAAIPRPRLPSAVAFAITRRGGFMRRFIPLKFDDTQGVSPSMVFWRFAAIDLPAATGLQSLAPAVLPVPVLRVGLIFGAVVGAIFC